MPASTLDLIDDSLRANLTKTSAASSSSPSSEGPLEVLGAAKNMLDDADFEPGGIYQNTTVDKTKLLYLKSSADTPQPSKPEDISGDETGLKPPKLELFSLESVQLGWRNKCDWSIGAGMFNMGNTCYLNSTLQALFHVPALANWLISEKDHASDCQDSANGLCVICAMRKTLQESQLRSGNAIRPVLICNKLRFLCRNFIPGRQEDAHEFLKCLLEAMEKAYLNRFKNHSEFDPRTKETTPLNQIMGGYLRSAVRCLKCGHLSTTHQHFQDLLLDIRKAQTVDEALEAYFSREKLDDDSYHCETCKKKVPATKQFALERAPMVLCIQLKRFSISNNKITKHVHFRQRLDLTRYTRERPSVPLIYRLVALISHLGLSNNCGHYTAVAQAPSGSFYQFDDNFVKVIPHQNVFQTNAYVMFYELESHPFTQRSNNNANIQIPKSLNINNNNNNNNKSAAVLQLAETNGVSKLNGKVGFTSDKVYGPELPPERLAEKNLQNGSSNNSNEKMTNGTPPKQMNGNGKHHQTTNGTSAGDSDTENASPSVTKKNKENNGSSSNEIKPLKPPPPSANGVLTKNTKVQSRTISSQNVPQSVSSSTSSSETPGSKDTRKLVPYETFDSSCSEESNQSTHSTEVQGRIATKASSMSDWRVSSTTAESEVTSQKSGSWQDKKNSTVALELYKMSHSGYGAPVQSWNGTRSQLDKEIGNERREDRKRALADQSSEYQSKPKHQRLNHSSYKSNPGYNPVQEFHNAKNWNQNGNHYKQFYNGGNRHRRNNNNYHHKNFHNKSHRFRQ